MASVPGVGARQRQLRIRVLEALEQRVKQFIRREELWPLRIPREPLLLDAVVRQALQAESAAFDPTALRSRPLLRLEWEDGSAWDAWVIVLPSGIKLYCDSMDTEDRVLASGGRNEGDESDRAFLQLLAESGGAHFGIEMSGGAPARVRTAVTDREFLADTFVNLFEVAGTEESVRDQLRAAADSPDAHTDARGDFRADVEHWLDRALRAPQPPRRR
jgi:hypothetical protein